MHRRHSSKLKIRHNLSPKVCINVFIKSYIKKLLYQNLNYSNKCNGMVGQDRYMPKVCPLFECGKVSGTSVLRSWTDFCQSCTTTELNLSRELREFIRMK